MRQAVKPKFGVGTTFKTGGKHGRIYTVVDYWASYNLAGEFVRGRYVATHQFLGQPLTDYDVIETTIARGLIEEKQP